jgi:hypothetical protein
LHDKRTITTLTKARFLNAQLSEDILEGGVQLVGLLHGEEGLQFIDVEDVHVLLEETTWIVAICPNMKQIIPMRKNHNEI